MARAAPPGALELWLHKATDPSTPEENWEGIQRFIDQVNADPSRTTAALTLLEHKIQSPQELEALRALTVLEMCVNNCGDAFHHEMGKFRFLNGLIKVLSPKHLGERSTDKVKSRIIEILFSWTVWFPQEMKIRDAYHMLKKQGIVKKDPKLLADKILPPPSPRPASSIFDGDDEKSKLLTQLLKSRNPEDLQAANRLIKGIIKEEQERAAKLSRRMNAVREAHSSAEALEKMLNACKTSAATGGPKPALESLQDIVAKCEKLKVVMFQVAKETVEDEEALAEVLQASDRLTQAILLFKEFGGICRSPATSSAEPTAATPAPADQANSMTLIDFSEPESAFQVPKLSQGNANPESRQGRLPSSSSIHSLDEELMSLGLPNSPPAAAAPFSSQAPPESPPCPVPSAASLAKLFIPLDSITLSSAIPPLSVYEENGLKAMLHFSQDLVPRQPTIRVLVLSLLSTSPHPIWDIVFQAAVPKSMALKLQPATGSQLPAFNPLQRPTVISQVLLLANPQKAPLRLRYKLTYTQKEQTFTKTGEVLDFPHTELWGGIL